MKKELGTYIEPYRKWRTKVDRIAATFGLAIFVGECGGFRDYKLYSIKRGIRSWVLLTSYREVVEDYLNWLGRQEKKAR